MKQASFLVNAWPTGRDAWGGINEYRHKTWCKCLRQAISAAREDGFSVTHEMQERMNVSVYVTLHAGRNGATAARNLYVYRDCIDLSLFDAHITSKMENIGKVSIAAERKSSPKKLGGTTVHVVWR